MTSGSYTQDTDESILARDDYEVLGTLLIGGR